MDELFMSGMKKHEVWAFPSWSYLPQTFSSTPNSPSLGLQIIVCTHELLTFGILPRFTFTLSIPPTWRLGFYAQFSDITSSHLCMGWQWRHHVCYIAAMLEVQSAAAVQHHERQTYVKFIFSKQLCVE